MQMTQVSCCTDLNFHEVHCFFRAWFRSLTFILFNFEGYQLSGRYVLHRIPSNFICWDILVPRFSHVVIFNKCLTLGTENYQLLECEGDLTLPIPTEYLEESTIYGNRGLSFTGLPFRMLFKDDTHSDLHWKAKANPFLSLVSPITVSLTPFGSHL